MTNNRLTHQRMLIRYPDQQMEYLLLLYGIYRDTIDPDIPFSKFVKMYISTDLIKIDVTVSYDGQERVGFSAAFFYTTVVNDKKAVIVRSATGLKEAYQGKGLHSQFDLYAKFMRFALKHPGKPIWVCAFVINALVFRDLCKFVPFVFPMPGREIPEHVQQVFDAILASGDHLPDKDHPLSLEVPIQVKFNEALLKRIFESTDPNVRWYLQANPRFLDKHGLLVVIGVSARNICGTLVNMMAHSSGRKMAGCSKSVRAAAKYLQQKTAILVDTISKRRIL